MKEILEAINKTKNSPFFWQYTDLDRLEELFIPSGWKRQHVITKELCDNALDAIERATLRGEITVTLTREGVLRVRNPGTIPVDELVKYDPESAACLFLNGSQLDEMKEWLPKTLKGDRWTEHKDFPRLMTKLGSGYKVNPVRPSPFGEKALKSRIMQVLELSKTSMRYGSINPYLKSSQGRSDDLGGTVEFVRFGGEGIHVVSINGTVLPEERLVIETPWNVLSSSVESLARGKGGRGGIVFIYQTTDRIFKGLNKMERVYIENETIAKLIVPPGERNEIKRASHVERINPLWLKAKEAQGYKDERMH